MNQSFTKSIESDSFIAKNGKTITVHFIQHATFYFSFGNIIIYADPVVYEGIDYKLLPKADLILITHDHYDHFDRNAIVEISKSNTVILCNEMVQKALETGFVLKNWDKTSFRDIVEIKALPAYNTTEGRDIYHPKNRDNGYVITLGGSNIYIPGDCEEMPEMKNFIDIDVAFLPINQPYTMTVGQAINAAKIIKPKILYPIHYSNTDLTGLSVLKNDKIQVRIFSM